MAAIVPDPEWHPETMGEAQARQLRAEIARLHAELANARLERDNIASLNSSLIAELAEAKARIAELEGCAIFEMHQREFARAERAEAERDRERLMRKLYEDAAKHWQPLAECAEARVAEFADKGTLQALRDANDRMERAEAELNEWEQCARYDAMMEGPRFKGWDRSQMERCRKSMEARRAALAPPPAGEKP